MSERFDSLTPELEDQLVRRLITDATHCVPLSRQKVLATGAVPSAGETRHLQECRRCSARLQALKAERGSEATEGSMCGGYDILSTVCAAIRSLTETSDWRMRDFENAWPILRDMIDGAMDAVRLGNDVYPRFADLYAEAVLRTPDTLKVVLVYGLTHLLESGEGATALAMHIARKIAENDDEIAHAVLAMTIQGEGPDLGGLIPRERWSEIREKTAGQVSRHVCQVNVDKKDFDRFFNERTPFESIVSIVGESIGPALEKMFDSSSDPLRRVLHLLSLRAYLAHVMQCMRNRPSDANRTFGSIAQLITDRRLVSGASFSLAMEACDKIGRLPWVRPVIAAPRRGADAAGEVFENYWPSRRRGHPRSPAAWAEAIAGAQGAIKVKLVYELAYLLGTDEKQLALEIAREIAKTDDEIAHRVLAMIIHTEGPELQELLPPERWTAIRTRTGCESSVFLRRIELVRRVVDELIVAATPLDAVRDLVKVVVMPVAGDLFDPRKDAVLRVIGLLSVRDCLAHLTERLCQLHGRTAAAPMLSEIERLMTRGREGFRSLALEACGRFVDVTCTCDGRKAAG